MSANPHRRSLLGLFAAAPLAAAAGGQPASALARVRFLAGSGHLDRHTAAGIARMQETITGHGIPGIGAALEHAAPLDTATPAELARLAERLDAPTSVLPADRLAAIDAFAALAVTFPPEIAAYRSFAPHLRRRLYADMLRRRAHLLALAEPPTRASPPPDQGA